MVEKNCHLEVAKAASVHSRVKGDGADVGLACHWESLQVLVEHRLVAGIAGLAGG